MKKAMWISYSSDEHEPNFPFNINDVINVEEDFEAGWANGLWEILDDEGFSISYEYSGELLNQCYLYKEQLLFGVKSTRLAKKLYPNAPEKEGMLWIKDDE